MHKKDEQDPHYIKCFDGKYRLGRGRSGLGAVRVRGDIGFSSVVNWASAVARTTSATERSTGIVTTVGIILALVGSRMISLATMLVCSVVRLLSVMAGVLLRGVRNRSWNSVGRLIDVELLVDGWGDWLDLGSKLLLDFV